MTNCRHIITDFVSSLTLNGLRELKAQISNDLNVISNYIHRIASFRAASNDLRQKCIIIVMFT